MPQVTVEGESTFEVPAGKKLVLGIEDAGIDILHRCGGIPACTTCRVQILSGDVPPASEKELETLEELAETYRLSCQIRVQNDLTVKVWGRSSEKEMAPGPRPED